MQRTDFSRTLIRCSSIGQIMTAPQGKSPRQKWLDACNELQEQEKKYAELEERLKNMATGRKIADKIVQLNLAVTELAKHRNDEPLSQTAKSYLAKVYAEVKYGKRSMQQLKGNKYTEKGKLVEEDGIDLVCMLDRRMLRKNDVRLTNEFLTGEPDLYLGDDIRNAEYVIDIKCPWDVETFFGNLGSPLNSDYFWQMQGYFALTNAPEGEVSYTLVSAPVDLILEEKRKLFYKLGVVTEEDPEFQRQFRELINNMTFEEMPPEHRRLKFPVQRDGALIEKIYGKVEQCRVYLSELERMHLPELVEEMETLETA
jgi:hypothetical protein